MEHSQTKKFGLLGRNISYSFSKKYFEEKFKVLHLPQHEYHLIDIPTEEDLKVFLSQHDFQGFNVTIPYKQIIIPLLDDISEEAKNVGAVNCIQIIDGKKIGHNTDVFGFEQTLLPYKKDHQNQAFILGNGGAAKAVEYVCKKNNIATTIISRKTSPALEKITGEMIPQDSIIIQCTPVGTFPNIHDTLPFPFESINQSHLVIDLIYNPPLTQFLENCKKNGATVVNGQLMLEQQAEKSWEIWNRTQKTIN